MLNQAIKQMLMNGSSQDEVIMTLIDSLASLIEYKEQPAIQLEKSKILLNKLTDEVFMVSEQCSLNTAIDYEGVVGGCSSEEGELVADSDFYTDKGINEPIFSEGELTVTEEKFKAEIEATMDGIAEGGPEESGNQCRIRKDIKSLKVKKQCLTLSPLLFDGVDFSLIREDTFPVALDEDLVNQH